MTRISKREPSSIVTALSISVNLRINSAKMKKADLHGSVKMERWLLCLLEISAKVPWFKELFSIREVAVTQVAGKMESGMTSMGYMKGMMTPRMRVTSSTV